MLALRLSDGEARDLALELPEPLREYPHRGRREMELPDPEESIPRVHERTGLSMAEADREVRTVLATPREAVSQEEHWHATSQLGNEYARTAETTSRRRGAGRSSRFSRHVPTRMNAWRIRAWSSSQIRVDRLLWEDRSSVTTQISPVGLASSTCCRNCW
ncbi:DUF2267 domain-containing protein [Streptomyces antimycoticus]|uniref:DUF2267 domain-containing protein n=1 Tax=Streptomyces antimycoticus TaxID=68175 RepID=UPI002570EA13|nr:DUF2267 domain-containing protein [Streptomyces antimycoticus]WJE00848.1 DUF2267 domain-containing protein [Streptomyces antimycoticus]